MTDSTSGLRQAQWPNAFRVAVGDGELQVYEWPGTGDPVLLLHASGFHGRCWDQVVKHLPGMHCYAVDMRFHGASSATGEVCWLRMKDDIVALLQQLKLQAVVGVGHSLGGHIVTRVAADLPHLFKQLLLIDPVIMAPERTRAELSKVAGLSPEAHPVSRRYNSWQSAEQMYVRFADKAPFNRWQPQVLRDYCNYGLKPSPEGGYELACNPLHEAAIYLNQRENASIHAILHRLMMPVTVLRCPAAEDITRDLAASPTWPQLVHSFPMAREHYLPDMDHFIPMCDPLLVADYIQQAQQHRWHSEK